MGACDGRLGNGIQDVGIPAAFLPYEIEFTTPGLYKYRSFTQEHRGMWGLITVKDDDPLPTFYSEDHVSRYVYAQNINQGEGITQTGFGDLIDFTYA